MDISTTLRRYDGKRVAPFREVAEAVRRDPDCAIGELVDLAERGTAPSGWQGEKLLSLLGRPLAHDALLHVLQTLPYMEIDSVKQGALRDALLALVKSKRALVRAWAYNGLGILAAQDSSLQNEVLSLFDLAARSETAAVKARIRHARTAIPS